MHFQKLYRGIIKAVAIIVLIWSSISGFAQESASEVAASASENSMPLEDPGLIATWLVFLLSYLVFPLTILAVIVGAGFLAYSIVIEGKTELGKFRRFVGALLPLILLSAAIAMRFDSYGAVVEYASSTPLWIRFCGGAVACIVVLELGRQIDEIQNDGIMALYAMLASSVAAFLIWALTAQVLETLGAELLGFVVAGAFHIIFRGLAFFEEKKAGK
jgi:hypothetical protein